MKDNKLCSIDISECIGRVETYMSRRTKEAFMASRLIKDAALQNLRTLAESNQGPPMI